MTRRKPLGSNTARSSAAGLLALIGLRTSLMGNLFGRSPRRIRRKPRDPSSDSTEFFLRGGHGASSDRSRFRHRGVARRGQPGRPGGLPAAFELVSSPIAADGGPADGSPAGAPCGSLRRGARGPGRGRAEAVAVFARASAAVLSLAASLRLGTVAPIAPASHPLPAPQRGPRRAMGLASARRIGVPVGRPAGRQRHQPESPPRP
jgi:hypothetical protein